MRRRQVFITIAVTLGVLLTVEALVLLRLATRVGTFASYWKNQNADAQGERTYITLGDSAAQGIGASEPEKGYVGLLSTALEDKNNITIRRINLSVSGAKVRDALDTQLPELKKQNITDDTIITLEVGANDMRSFEAEAFHSAMNELLSHMPKQTVVAEVPYFGGGRFLMFEKNVLAANEIIHELANKYDLKVAPLHEVTKKRDSIKVYAPDLFHPSNTGYKNWADAFLSVLDV